MPSGRELTFETERIPGGNCLIGTSVPCIPADGEDPLRKTRIAPFRMGVTTVTNAEFKKFKDETGHFTEADQFGWSFMFHAQAPESVGPTQDVGGVEWWRRVDGANWREVNGPNTEGDSWKPDHPVVHVSWSADGYYTIAVQHSDMKRRKRSPSARIPRPTATLRH